MTKIAGYRGIPEVTVRSVASVVRQVVSSLEARGR